MYECSNEIMNIMNKIEYGFKDKDGNNIIDYDPKKWKEEFNIFYHLQTPEVLLETKCGVCWDQVELERKLFMDENINVKTYFVFISDNDMLPSHTFLTYEDNHKYYWFEHSWNKHKGIHEYNSESDLLLDVVKLFKDDHKNVSDDAKIYLYEYQKPKSHISCDEFYKYIETQKNIELE